jgi:hypothetical protein
MKFFIILCFFWSLQLHAVHIREIQEVRFAQAEISYAEGKRAETLKTLSLNVISNYVHPPSYHLLATIYFDLGEEKKGMTVLYTLLKRLHGEKLLRIKTEDIDSILPTVPPPGPIAKKQYYVIAKKYFDMANNRNADDEIKWRFYELSFKYFTICEKYSYETESSNYFLAIVHNRLGEHRQALARLQKVKDQKEKHNLDPEDDSTLKFYLADSLLRDSQTDAGALYLQSIFLAPQTDSTLRTLADAYLKSITQNYFYLRAATGINYNNNIHGLTDEQKNNFDSYKNRYHEISGYSLSKSANAYWNIGRFDHFSFLTSLSYGDNLQMERKVSFQDTSYWFFVVEGRYDNHEKFLAKLNYSFLKRQYRLSEDSKLESYSNSHIFSPTVYYRLRDGTVQYNLTFSTGKNNAYTKTVSSWGLQFAYTPIWTSSYFAPTYSFYLGEEDELLDYNSSSQVKFAFANVMSLSQQLNYIFEFDYLDNNNDLDLARYSQLHLSNMLNINFKKFPKLNFKIDLDYYNKEYEITGSVKSLIFGTEISYIF